MRLNNMPTTQNAIFLDRDGTINVDKNYLYKISDFEFLPGAVDALKKFKQAGYILIIVTNQSGIGRGYYTEDDFEKLNSWMLSELEKQGVHIDATYYCPHLPDAQVEKYKTECECRKPRLGLFEKAIKEFNIDTSGSIAIGDRERDVEICKKYPAMKGFVVYSREATTKENVSFISGGLGEVAEKL